MPELVKNKITRKSKEAKIGLLWNGKSFPFVKITWQPKGILVIRSVYFKDLGEAIEWGKLKINESAELMPIPGEKKKSIHKNLKLTLHPPENGKRGCLVAHSDFDKCVLPENRRTMDWFPVVKPFHLLSIGSPSLERLVPKEEQFDFLIPIDKALAGFVRCKVDIFPPNEPVVAGEGALAFTPNYTVRIGFEGTNEPKDGAVIIYPLGEELNL